MPSLNRVQLMGHMSRDAEMRYTPNGKAVTNFSIATNFGSGDRKTTDFHDCVVWDLNEKAPRAQWASKLKKGDLVYVEGRITHRDWEDKDGNKRRNTEIVCDRADLLRNKLDGTARVEEIDPDEVPF